MTVSLSPLTSQLVLRNHRMTPRLLVSDADPVLLQIYGAYFPNFGFEVATAGNGLECVEQLREFSPDLLVLSHELCWGGADGVLSIVRETSSMRPIPVILTVGEISRLKVVRLLAPPIVKLLEKPFRLRNLHAAIEAALLAPIQQYTTSVSSVPAAFASDRTRRDTDLPSITTGNY